VNVVSMMHEINFVANPVIGEPALPHLALSADDSAELMRVCTFDQLNSPLNRYVQRRSQQEMNVLRHKDERVQFVPALTAMPIEGSQKKPNVRFDDEQPAAIPSREGYEIRSGRRDESSRLQGETSAAESRAYPESVNWHEWNSRPSRLFL
jgi:hypothetical protein